MTVTEQTILCKQTNKQANKQTNKQANKPFHFAANAAICALCDESPVLFLTLPVLLVDLIAPLVAFECHPL